MKNKNVRPVTAKKIDDRIDVDLCSHDGKRSSVGCNENSLSSDNKDVFFGNTHP